MNLALPTITTGGTSATRLLDDICRAVAASMEAATALQGVAPHGCDYPDQAVLQRATEEHTRRLNRVVDTVTELNTLADYVADYVK